MEQDYQHYIDYFKRLPEDQQAAALRWIRNNLEPHKRRHDQHSYGLKHFLERDTDLYLEDDRFKGAMLVAGYKPMNSSAVHWEFKCWWTAAHKQRMEDEAFAQWVNGGHIQRWEHLEALNTRSGRARKRTHRVNELVKIGCPITVARRMVRG